MAAAGIQRRFPLAQWAIQGAIGGVIGGLALMAFEILLAIILTRQPLMPLQGISAILLGTGALSGHYPTASVAVVGLGLHVVLSLVFGTIFGVGFGVGSSLFSPLAQRPWLVIPAAAIYGCVLWLVNVYLIAPAAGWFWIPRGNPVEAFFANTVFFGMALGGYLWSRMVQQRV